MEHLLEVKDVTKIYEGGVLAMVLKCLTLRYLLPVAS